MRKHISMAVMNPRADMVMRIAGAAARSAVMSVLCLVVCLGVLVAYVRHAGDRSPGAAGGGESLHDGAGDPADPAAAPGLADGCVLGHDMVHHLVFPFPFPGEPRSDSPCARGLVPPGTVT